LYLSSLDLLLPLFYSLQSAKNRTWGTWPREHDFGEIIDTGDFGEIIDD